MSGQDNVHDFPFTIAFLLLSEEAHIEVQEKVFCNICVVFIITLSALCYNQKIVEVVFSFLCIGECRSSLSDYWRESLWCQKIHFRIYWIALLSFPFFIFFSMWRNNAPICVPGEGPVVYARELCGCWAEQAERLTLSCFVFFTGSEHRGLSLPRLNTCLFCFVLVELSACHVQMAVISHKLSPDHAPQLSWTISLVELFNKDGTGSISPHPTLANGRRLCLFVCISHSNQLH